MKYLILLLLSFSTYASEAGVLHDKVSQVAPISGVSLGKLDDKTTWRIDFKPEATPEQRSAAQQLLQNFDASVVVADKSDTDKLNDKINVLFGILGTIGAAVLGKAAYDKLKVDTEKAN